MNYFPPHASTLLLQVYYVPLVPVVDGDCMPTFIAFFPIFRQILIRERITLVHGHQASSVMSHEAILFAKTMGYRVAYTDHSLFGFADAARYTEPPGDFWGCCSSLIRTGNARVVFISC